MSPIRRTRLCALLLLGCAACERPREPAPEVEPPPGPPRAETIQDTLMLEGMPEPVTSRLVRSPVGVEPGFTTYLPPGLSMHADPAGDSAWARFSASFAGPADPNAYMHVRIYPEGPEHLETARNVIAGFLRSRRLEDDPVGDLVATGEAYRQVKPPPWAEEAFSFDYVGHGNVRFTGMTALARRGARWFHVLTHYPVEFGDGLAPRFEYVLRHWRWADTREPLVPAAADTAGP
jgi:hypothetical protein